MTVPLPITHITANCLLGFLALGTNVQRITMEFPATSLIASTIHILMYMLKGSSSLKTLRFYQHVGEGFLAKIPQRWSSTTRRFLSRFKYQDVDVDLIQIWTPNDAGSQSEFEVVSATVRYTIALFTDGTEKFMSLTLFSAPNDATDLGFGLEEPIPLDDILYGTLTNVIKCKTASVEWSSGEERSAFGGEEG